MTTDPAPLRLLHTSDWHLGQDLHGLPRDAEHRAFLDWLLDTMDDQDVDALLVTGDVFDSQNPPVSAQRRLYDFLAKAKKRRPKLDIVIIGGNHDSATRLEAPDAILKPFDVRVIGSLPRDPADALVTLRDAGDRPRAMVCAVPFLRMADLPPLKEADDTRDPLIDGVRSVYDRFITHARAAAGDLPLIVTGHCYMSGAALSELSERRVLGGNQHALPADIFPDDCAYVALGHLHKPQRVAGRETMRYSGSPFPLSVTEKDYRHQALLVEVTDAATPCTVTGLPVPRVIDYIRIPSTGAAPPETVLKELEDLPAEPDPGRDLRPYLEVVVRLDAPSPSLRHDVEQALADKPVRLCRLAVEYSGTGQALAATADAPDLAGLDPEEVFEKAWARAYDGTPDAAHRHAFHELMEAVQGEAPEHPAAAEEAPA
ncbi:exonuclease SbcCD subunit D C-terminal domain-containing protein [Caenispirillum salinarum]|uniref:exonuclease SbcCD subunit D C-terminal domain-containing protein n=1 Tax=Caenispirillum salinarum TaxID=859058 RepID=UPI00384E8A77